MRIAIDAHAIGNRQTGNEVYVRSLLRHFVELEPRNDYLAYVSSKISASDVPGAVKTRRVASNPFVRLGHQLGSHLREDRPDLVHVQYTAPLRCPVPIVVTVHDVSFLKHPDFFSPFRQKQLALTVAHTVQRAARIITCSEFSRQAIAAAYNLDPETIRVAHNAAAPGFHPADGHRAKAIVRERYGISAPFLLCVGNLQRRKNQLGLIQAYESLIQAHPEFEQDLVFVGKDTSQSGEIRELARKSSVRQRIHFAGFVPDELLPAFYNAADLFVFPSFYEGFGIPLLEAMACGRPIACSNCTAMPEVTGKTAVLFDPSSKQSIGQALHDMLANLDLCQKLGEAALHRSRSFRWDATARTVLNVYRELASVPSRAVESSAPRALASGS
ncbi:MAG: glycosyltransferase family 4 protein [Bryobacterales bacterium]|nr:glycosyltransferase family 4 protein [Bryobacterales bacterium]